MPSRRRSQTPVIAVRITRPTVGKAPISAPTSMRMTISISGTRKNISVAIFKTVIVINNLVERITETVISCVRLED